MSHVVTVKESNISVPGRGIVPDETQLLLDQRQLDSMNKGPLFGSGKLLYSDPGLIVKPIANLNTGLVAGAVISGAGQQMSYAGSVVGLGLLHVAAPVTTGLNVTLGVAVGADGTTYVVPKTGNTVVFNVVAEVQSLVGSGTVSGGTFTLRLLNTTTGPIAYNATAANVKTAIDAAIAGNTVATAGGPLPGTAVTLTYTGYGQVEPAVVNNTNVTGGGSFGVTTTTSGVGTPYTLSNWGVIKPLKFKKGQWLLPECVAVGTAFVSGAALVALAIEADTTAYSVYS